MSDVKEKDLVEQENRQEQIRKKNIKQDTPEKKKSRLVEVLTKEYRWENLVIGVLAIFAAAVAALLISGTLQIQASTPILGPIIGVSPNDKIFAWVLMAVAMIGLFVVLYPFVMPAIPELKKISWPTWKIFLDNAIRTLIFVILLALLLSYFDFVASHIVSWIRGLIKW